MKKSLDWWVLMSAFLGGSILTATTTTEVIFDKHPLGILGILLIPAFFYIYYSSLQDYIKEQKRSED